MALTCAIAGRIAGTGRAVWWGAVRVGMRGLYVRGEEECGRRLVERVLQVVGGRERDGGFCGAQLAARRGHCRLSGRARCDTVKGNAWSMPVHAQSGVSESR